MVNVNKLKKPVAAPAKPAAKETINITPADVGKAPANLIQTKVDVPKSLQQATQGFVLPSFLDKDTTGVPELIAPELTGYVGFADPMSKNWQQMVAAGCEKGDAFIAKDNQFFKASPLQYFLLEGTTFRTTMVGQEGKFTFVSRDIDTPVSELIAQYPGKAKVGMTGPEAHYCCLLLVLMNGESLVPIKADFRGTKTGAAEGPFRAIEAAATAEWGNISQNHKISMMFPKPWGRVFHTITTHPRTGKQSGNNFFVCSAQSTPTTVDQMQMLYAAFKDDSFNAELAEAYSNYQARIEFFDKLASQIAG